MLDDGVGIDDIEGPVGELIERARVARQARERRGDRHGLEIEQDDIERLAAPEVGVRLPVRHLPADVEDRTFTFLRHDGVDHRHERLETSATEAIAVNVLVRCAQQHGSRVPASGRNNRLQT